MQTRNEFETRGGVVSPNALELGAGRVGLP